MQGFPGGSDSMGAMYLLIPIQQARVKEGLPVTLLITERGLFLVVQW